jgi:hypothetical protein
MAVEQVPQAATDSCRILAIATEAAAGSTPVTRHPMLASTTTYRPVPLPTTSTRSAGRTNRETTSDSQGRRPEAMSDSSTKNSL